MKKYIFIFFILFTGCSYKHTSIDNSKLFLASKKCTKIESKYQQNRIIIKEICQNRYIGKETEIIDVCKFDTVNYLKGFILEPIAGLFVLLPMALMFEEGFEIKESNGMTKQVLIDNILYPITAPFNRNKNCKAEVLFQPYEKKDRLIHTTQKDIIKVEKIDYMDYKTLFISNTKLSFELHLNNNLTYSIEKDKIDSLCSNKQNCILNILKKENSKLVLLDTIEIK